MSLTESAYAPDLRSVLPDLQHEDADDEIVADLARALRGPAEKCLVASGDFSATFAGQPHSAGISPAEWNLSDQVALAQMHAVCALAGCDISVAHTGGCTPLELERLGLGEASPAVLGNAISAARSAGSKYVMAELAYDSVRKCAGAAEAAEQLAGQAVQIADSNVHGLLVTIGDADASPAVVRALREVTALPLAVLLGISPAAAAARGDDWLVELCEDLSGQGVACLGLDCCCVADLEPMRDVDQAVRGCRMGVWLRISDEKTVLAACAEQEAFDSAAPRGRVRNASAGRRGLIGSLCASREFIRPNVCSLGVGFTHADAGDLVECLERSRA